MSKRIPLPLKWHGGKYYLAPQIVALMPDHLHYVEPFCGGCAVLLAHDGHGRSELINDINAHLTNFWTVLKNEKTFAAFQRILDAVPLSKNEWNNAKGFLEEWHKGESNASNGDMSVARAAAFLVFCRQSLAGRMKSFTSPTRTRLRRGINGNVSEWLGAVDGLAIVHARLRTVMIENMDAVRLIVREDTPQTLFYLDPPYLQETRSAPDVYTHEMSEAEHRRLLGVLPALQGKVMLSGYRSDLYDDQLAGWTRHEFDLPNNAAGGAEKRRMVECLWCNF